MYKSYSSNGLSKKNRSSRSYRRKSPILLKASKSQRLVKVSEDMNKITPALGARGNNTARNRANQRKSVRIKRKGQKDKSADNNHRRILNSDDDLECILREDNLIEDKSDFEINSKGINIFGGNLSGESLTYYGEDSYYGEDGKSSECSIVIISPKDVLFNSCCILPSHRESCSLDNINQIKKKVSIGDFLLIKSLASGAYGKVILSRKKNTKDMFAIKVLEISKMIDKNC